MKKLTLILFLVATGIQFVGAQEVLTIGAETTDISSESGKNYDRIEMIRNIPAGKYSAFAVASTVDGYYFGVNAPRFVASRTQDGGYNVLRVMEDTEDFEPGNIYLVKPVNGWGVTTDSPIVSFTAGIKTTVTGTDLSYTNDFKVRQAVSSIAKLVDKLNKATSATEINNGKRDIDELLKMSSVK